MAVARNQNLPAEYLPAGRAPIHEMARWEPLSEKGDECVDCSRMLGRRQTPCIARFATPNEEVENASFVFLDDPFELGCVQFCPGRKGINVIVTYDEVEEGFDGCLRCWGRRGDSQDMKGMRCLGL